MENSTNPPPLPASALLLFFAARNSLVTAETSPTRPCCSKKCQKKRRVCSLLPLIYSSSFTPSSAAPSLGQLCSRGSGSGAAVGRGSSRRKLTALQLFSRNFLRLVRRTYCRWPKRQARELLCSLTAGDFTEKLFFYFLFFKPSSWWWQSYVKTAPLCRAWKPISVIGWFQTLPYKRT